jgi:site-specific recombinase XerD
MLPAAAARPRRCPVSGKAVHLGTRAVAYPADPPRVEEIIAVMRTAGESIHGARVRALVVILWRAGLRINEALMLAETDLVPRRGSILVRCGKGGKRREVGMDEWAWEHVQPWQHRRLELPVGPLFCVIDGATRGRAWSQTGARCELRRLAVAAGVRRRFAPHQLRHAHAVAMAREGVPLPVIQRQLATPISIIAEAKIQPARTRESRETVNRCAN